MRQKLQKLFIPHKDNGFKPNILERFSMGIMLVLVLLSFTLANIQAILWIGSDTLISAILPAVIVDLTNTERDDEVLRTLKRNPTLDHAAKLKAEHMAAHSYFSHYSPDGVSPWHWFDVAGYAYLHAGENLAVHFTDSGDVVEAWMDSPSHRANILNSNYTEIGVGTARGEYQGFPTVFVVQLFGTPQAVASGAVASAEDTAVTLETTSDPNPVSENTETAVAQASFETIEEEVPAEPISAQESVVVYSDLATTSRPGVPATTENAGPDAGLGETPYESNIIAKSATQPSLWLEVVYAVLALFVVAALVISIVIEWRHQHPVQIAYAGGLLIVMALLYHVHTLLTGSVTIV